MKTVTTSEMDEKYQILIVFFTFIVINTYAGLLQRFSFVIFNYLWSIINTLVAFSEVPITQIVAANSTAVYRCNHDTADVIRWRVNESLIGRNPPPGITLGTERDENDNLIDTLMIVAYPEYNQTEVKCVAKFDDDSTDETTNGALLIIHQQGKI